MNIYVKRNSFNYDGEIYTKDILLRVEDECECLNKVETIIQTSEKTADFNFKNAEMHLYLIQKYMETDIDYDWDENPIEFNYEESTFIPINYCPFCGNEINIIVDKTVDKTKEVTPLMDELKKLRKKKKIKNSYIVRKQINQLMLQ